MEQLGEGVPEGRWRNGDRVAALATGGAYAELCVVEEPCAMRLPPEMPLRLAASIPEAWLTAFQLLHLVGKVKQGDHVLVHAAANGVGLAAVQLAQEAGAIPIGTALGPKHGAVRERGVQHVVDYKAGPFVDAVKVATPEGRGVDLVLDCVGGGDYTRQNLESLAAGGRLVVYGTMGGSVVPEFDLRVLMRKALTIRGSTLRARPFAYKADLVARFWTPERFQVCERGVAEPNPQRVGPGQRGPVPCDDGTEPKHRQNRGVRRSEPIINELFEDERINPLK